MKSQEPQEMCRVPSNLSECHKQSEKDVVYTETNFLKCSSLTEIKTTEIIDHHSELFQHKMLIHYLF